jgi:hypothetical protein
MRKILGPAREEVVEPDHVVTIGQELVDQV